MQTLNQRILERLQELKRLASDEITRVHVGEYSICHWLGADLSPHVRKHFTTWSQYSGSIVFPVPARDASMFQKHRDEGTLWDGEYGVLRMQLLDHLISALQRGNPYTRKAELLTLLRGIKLQSDYVGLMNGGICHELKRLSDDNDRDDLKPYFCSWRYFSGCVVYPVPHTKNTFKRWWSRVNGTSRELAQVQFSNSTVREMWTGEYGELRRDLLDHIIESIQQELIEMGAN